MDIRTILDNNIHEYSDCVDKDVAENMNRLYYRGIAAHDPDDENLLSLLILGAEVRGRQQGYPVRT